MMKKCITLSVVVTTFVAMSCARDVPASNGGGDELEMLRRWDGTSSDHRGLQAYQSILRSVERQQYVADDIDRLLSVIYGGDDVHVPGSGMWNLKYGELLSTYYGAYERHPREDQARRIPPIVGVGLGVFCRHPEELWPSTERGLIQVNVTPAWRLSDGWRVRVSQPSGESAEGFAGGTLIVPVPAMNAGTHSVALTIEVFENCTAMTHMAVPIHSMVLEVDFDVDDILGDARVKREAELAQSIVDAISISLEKFDEAFKDAALDESPVLVPELRVDWKTIAAKAADSLAVGLEVTLVDDRGRERARMVAAGAGGRGVVWRTASHMTVLCDEEVSNWRVRVRSSAPLVSLYDRTIWDHLQAGRVALWQTDDIEVPMTRLMGQSEPESPVVEARRMKAEAVQIARAVADGHGIDLEGWPEPDAHFDEHQGKWWIHFTRHRYPGDHFSVSIDDATDETKLFRGR